MKIIKRIFIGLVIIVVLLVLAFLANIGYWEIKRIYKEAKLDDERINNSKILSQYISYRDDVKFVGDTFTILNDNSVIYTELFSNELDKEVK